ncbi:hypothetical protein BT96DRAFT_675952 [Gymnopus androsaceus JB14]|uniref:Uncharacterized protein n=1 Tax=Gymnopus androsaceus JB14 TaxID=1447944 RepID=A0A6A4HSG2_9AGAR|nr:hypothetical protein BT96DRAFT_675952 [Gymnopus androsaceus JB14]
MADISFVHLLTSNDPPDDSEIPHIRSAILIAQDRLRSLDEQLFQLEQDPLFDEEDIAEAQLLRDEQRTEILQLQSTLSHLRHFPPEILALIFSFALPSGEKGVPMDANSVLWRASQVCQLWRGIICEGMQHIWSSIEIDCLKVERHNLTSTLLELALQRSGTRSLSIRFCFGLRNRMGLLTRNEELCLTLLTNESFRWKEVELDHIPIAVLDSLSAAVKSRMPMLRRLAIENVPMSLDWDTPPTAEAFEIAPQLEHFSLSGYFRPSRFQLPWSQLSSYAGSFRDIKDFLMVLACASNLATCDVFLLNYHTGFIVDHPNIQMLRIRGAVEGLARLRLPSLQSLALDELILQDLGTISMFVRRTPSIASLEAHIPHESGASNSVEILLDFINACENISTLVLRGEVDMLTVCSLLNTDSLGGSRVLMPRLRHLSFSVLTTTNAEFVNVLIAMLESRRRPTLDDLEDISLSSLTLLALRATGPLFQRLISSEGELGLKVAVKIANA